MQGSEACQPQLHQRDGLVTLVSAWRGLRNLTAASPWGRCWGASLAIGGASVWRAAQLTTAADIYSLGVILYQLLTGYVPFHANSPVELLRLITDREPPRPRALQPARSRSAIWKQSASKCGESACSALHQRFNWPRISPAGLRRANHPCPAGEPDGNAPGVKLWARRRTAPARVPIAVFCRRHGGAILCWWFQISKIENALRESQRNEQRAPTRLPRALSQKAGAELQTVRARAS